MCPQLVLCMLHCGEAEVRPGNLHSAKWTSSTFSALSISSQQKNAGFFFGGGNQKDNAALFHLELHTKGDENTGDKKVVPGRMSNPIKESWTNSIFFCNSLLSQQEYSS
ncbi:uncharacterized protein ACO6RY_04492 [Pungitius sinensis]